MNIFSLFRSKKPVDRSRRYTWKDSVEDRFIENADRLDSHESEIGSLWAAIGSVQSAQAAAPAAPAGQTQNTESLEALKPLAELEPVDGEVSYDG